MYVCMYVWMYVINMYVWMYVYIHLYTVFFLYIGYINVHVYCPVFQLLEFDQTDFRRKDDGLAESGYIFVPSNCTSLEKGKS